MSQAPAPGWYTDPEGLHSHRWWDGQAWTAHVNNPLPAHVNSPAPAPVVPEPAQFAPPAHSVFYGGPVTTAPVQQTALRPSAKAGGVEGNKYAFITVGIVALYVLLALKAHVYILGILPVIMSIRSTKQRETLAPVAIIAAVVAVIIAVSGFSHH